MYVQGQLSRQAAEASEAKALQAASEHAQMFDALLVEMQRRTATSQRRARLQAADGQLPKSVAAVPAKQQEDCARALEPAGAASAAAAVSAPACSCAGSLQHAPAALLPAADKMAVSHGSNSGSPRAAAPPALAVPGDTAQRARRHKQLQQGLAADRKALAEVAAAQRRAAAAAELEECKRASVTFCCVNVTPLSLTLYSVGQQLNWHNACLFGHAVAVVHCLCLHEREDIGLRLQCSMSNAVQHAAV